MATSRAQADSISATRSAERAARSLYLTSGIGDVAELIRSLGIEPGHAANLWEATVDALDADNGSDSDGDWMMVAELIADLSR